MRWGGDCKEFWTDCDNSRAEEELLRKSEGHIQAIMAGKAFQKSPIRTPLPLSVREAVSWGLGPRDPQVRYGLVNICGRVTELSVGCQKKDASILFF